ncbi:peroxisomal 2,4-dienoyl-CoA reductase [Cryptococcus deuterogattii 99/473]|uniref:2,4-dienoyl-CoA reductase [(3E)-enoyl-CoA-producing] n=2 Tax=Cryptococcus deuterogattii TaxID=1859096 RepID=A0A0D0T6R4_9TREE|nr:peroxisomal 2 [Cryptococcus deuterogattii R265]KIR29258.1 peroxisomal 2,4-dienoyl-CoA reductase [Cryptococcus deuterogattii LA55]KIR34063.1 peroxisomal 2,4-dienoyl-CoA reductase [Cryptococcus deuterogattii MMRL2647]KIR41552.1 peroxisomal 2,4-dienoyl-CoA reductase [Cryptococcus deuterogattii Ram5]KIR71794.1 peroxisomal 2,4-dienoyl-CoA reductase [Cryptococcus deuterogattii CA1014]KIR91376.1 peroxisomal 2,4-dienoyl-CoA reductase [Cryptococcus deuterogattii CBS 10090]KIR98435.1 peroxisomal 2,4
MTPPPLPDPKSTFKPDLFKGKVLFCTGGRSGICYQIVETMMSLGVDAAIVGRDAKGLEESAKRLEETTGRKCIPAPADVRQPDQLKNAVKRTQDAFDRIDFVICGAAGNFLAPISGLTERAFRTVIEIDLLGTYNTLKATLPLVRSSQGSYVHISATFHYRGVPYQSHVGAAKAGVDALSHSIAVEEGPWGVRSNVIAPGPIAGTVGMDKLGVKGHKIEREVPLGRLGSTVDIANAAVFLFSPASAWITGSTLVVDGGENHIRTTMLPYPESLLDPESVKSLIKPRL